MDLDTNTASAVVWALGLVRGHDDLSAPLKAAGINLHDVERFEGVSDELGETLPTSAGDISSSKALALGLLAGRASHLHPRPRRLQDPTAFVMNKELVVESAHGQSILRLPWFEDGLFVGRQLPDISEMPKAVRSLCIEYYSAALNGERGRFAFTSYGHHYSVDAVPVRGEDGYPETVLAVATPAPFFASAAAAQQRAAEQLDRSAELAEERAERYRLAGHRESADTERAKARDARRDADRARASARRLHSRDTGAGTEAPSLTSRQIEILALASYGLTSAQIAEQLGVSVTTVKTHFDNIYARLGVNERSAAVAAALRHGLIQ